MSSSSAQTRIKEIRKTPLVMTGIFLELLRSHFKRNSVQFMWSEDPVDTQLVLEPIHKLNFEEVQKRPAVYVARGPFQYNPNRLAFDDQSGMELTTGKMSQLVRIECPMQLIPVGRRMGEVERLAEEVSEVVLVFKSLIRQDYNFLRFDLSGIAPLGVVQEDREYFTAPITVRTEFTDAWSITPFTAKLNQVMVDIRTGLDRPSATMSPGTPFDSQFNPEDPCPKPSFCELPPDDLRTPEGDETSTELGFGYGDGEYS